MALSVEAGELELYLWASDDGPQPPVADRVPCGDGGRRR